MSTRFPRLYRGLLWLLPAAVRRERGDDMVEAFLACRDRERARLGIAGLGHVWIRSTVDVIVAAITIRLDARRTQRIAALAYTSPSGDHVMNQIWTDLWYAARRMRQAPLFSTAIVLTLALAIGATTAIFSVVDTVLLRGLPYPQADRLVMVYLGWKAAPRPMGFSPPDYLAFEERATAFAEMAAFRNREYELSGVRQPERIVAARVSASLFETLGVPPLHGRAFTREEDQGQQPVAVLSDKLWRRVFGGDTAAIGRSVILDRRPYTIVGIMPPTFGFPGRGPVMNNVPADVFLPISFTAVERRAFASGYNNSVIARLKPGVTLGQAEAETQSVVQAAAVEMYPANLRMLAQALSASTTPLREETVGRARLMLWLLFAAVVVVLLIACADLANLMLTRAVTRQREMAVRTALGAGRHRLIQQSLVESAALSACGAVLGLFVTRWVVAALISAAPATLPRLQEVRLDLRVLGFTAVLSIATAILCGLLPALEASRSGSGEALKEGGRTGSAGPRQRRIFGTLVTAQFALAVVLLVGGGLLVRSFTRLLGVDPGFRAERVLTLATSLPANAYPQGTDVRSFYTRLLAELQGLPGARAAAASTDLPLGMREVLAFTIENEQEATRGLSHGVAHDWVAGSYFEALGIPLKRGRYLSPEDDQASERVVVVNETMARMFWRDVDPVGQRLAWGLPDDHGPWTRIVGVVADVKQGPLNSEVAPQTFQPWLQMADSRLAENVVGQLRAMKISVRTATDPMLLASAVQARIHALDPSLPLTAVQTLEEVVSTSAAPQRFNMVLLASFALLALLLAALGIAGILATSVSRRTQELGLRMALGARRGALLRMVVREGMVFAVAGLAIGVAAAFGLTRFMATLLFEVSPYDPVTFASVTALLLFVALIACYVPARRATAIEPMAALRRD